MEGKIYGLEKIKSNIILKRILNGITKYKYFHLINFNKALQKRINININDYKNLTKKIKIGPRNGFGKEFKKDNEILIFEGEYINGKKSGKGQEYYENGQIKFEGEYFEGRKIEGKGYDNKGNEYLKIERNGKGKEYNKNGKVVFEGEYFNGKRWNGTRYNEKNELIFQIKNGKGKGKIFNFNCKLEYDGEYLNGERNGKGKEYNDKGLV